jgi:hypothetical protein
MPVGTLLAWICRSTVVCCLVLSSCLAAGCRPEPAPGSVVFERYLTAYGLGPEEWDTAVEAFRHFDMAAIDNPDTSPFPVPLRREYSHKRLRLLAYVDLVDEVQYAGETDFDPDSPTYWGRHIVSSFERWQESTNSGFDGIFVDNAFGDAYGAPATYADVFVLLDWLTGRLDGAKKVPLVLANGGNERLAEHADIWMSESFADPDTGWKGSVISQINDIAGATGSGGSVVALTRTLPNTEQYCLYALAAFLIANKGKSYFSFSDIWGNGQPAGPARGWYPIMDVDCGSPLEDFVRKGDVLTREYTRVTVTVDLSAMIGRIDKK